MGWRELILPGTGRILIKEMLKPFGTSGEFLLFSNQEGSQHAVRTSLTLYWVGERLDSGCEMHYISSHELYGNCYFIKWCFTWTKFKNGSIVCCISKFKFPQILGKSICSVWQSRVLAKKAFAETASLWTMPPCPDLKRMWLTTSRYSKTCKLYCTFKCSAQGRWCS